MPRLAPTPLHLSETEREQLQQLVNRHSTPGQSAIKASIILLADEGQNHRDDRPYPRHQPRYGMTVG